MHVGAVRCISAAEQAGKKLALCEMYAIMSPGFVFRDMMHLFELFRAPMGVDFERTHLLGDFSVDAISEYPTGSEFVRFAKHFFMVKRKEIQCVSDITFDGYGCVEYTAKIKVTKEMLSAEDAVLRIGVYSGCTSTVFVNDKKAGHIGKELYSLSLKEVLSSGKNTVNIRL